MPKAKTPVPQKVCDRMDAGLPQRKAVSYAGLDEPAKGAAK